GGGDPTDPNGPTEGSCDSASCRTDHPVLRPNLALSKVLLAGPTPVSQAGQVLKYRITVSNTGEVDLEDITVSDVLNDAPQILPAPQGDGGITGVLEVGEVWTYDTSYVVTEADLSDVTRLVNVATVSTSTPGTPEVPSSEVDVPVEWNPLVANDDPLPPTNGRDGGTVPGTVHDNDSLNGTPVDPSDITTTVVTPATPAEPGKPVPELDPSTGVVTVPPGTPSGDYQISYQICEVLTPATCDTAVVQVPVSESPIHANDDPLPPTNGRDGG